MSRYRNLVLDADGPVAVLTIDRPARLNALDHETILEIRDAVREVRDSETVRGLVLTGAGEKAFVAGADISQLASLGPLQALEVSRLGQDVFTEIESCRKPVVAAVNGFALGGGCELALACHLRLAATTARFGLPEVKLGIIPGYGGTVRLPRLIGRGRALEMILTGEMVDADEAYRIGLVNRVVEGEHLLTEARSLVTRIAENGPLAVGMAIASVNRGEGLETGAALAVEANLFGVLAASEDMREGMAAFLEKRSPRFTGR